MAGQMRRSPLAALTGGNGIVSECIPAALALILGLTALRYSSVLYVHCTR